jgi:hypothetical protein
VDGVRLLVFVRGARRDRWQGERVCLGVRRTDHDLPIVAGVHVIADWRPVAGQALPGALNASGRGRAPLLMQDEIRTPAFTVDVERDLQIDLRREELPNR